MSSEATKERKRCPTCGERSGPRTLPARCIDCAREYCPACLDYRGGWMSRVCPDCGSNQAMLF